MYLNQNFFSYNTLLAENYFMIGNYKNQKKYTLFLKIFGKIFSWHASKQIALFDLRKLQINKQLKYLKKTIKKLKSQMYQTFDYASF